MFEANCSRQMGQHKKKDLSPNVFVFTRGVTKVRVSDAYRKDTKPSAFLECVWQPVPEGMSEGRGFEGRHAVMYADR